MNYPSDRIMNYCTTAVSDRGIGYHKMAVPFGSIGTGR